MKKNLMFLAFAALGLASCNGGFKKGDAGMLYSIHEDKSGPNIQPGDFISVNLIAKTDGDSVLMSTYDLGHPSPTIMPKPQSKGDIYSGLLMLSEGDSATIKTNVDSVFKKGNRPPNFKGKYIVYTVKVVKVIPKGKLSDQVFQGRIGEYFKAQSAVLKKEEPAKIKKYIADNKLTPTQTASGLNYVINKQGDGVKPAVGDSVEVNYTGRFLTGKVFDTNDRQEAIKAKTFNPQNPYKAIRIPVGEKKVIPGWDEGLQLLSKGAKATFVIPSNLAYGEQGYGPIQPYTPLVFDVEVVNIIHPNPNAPKAPAPIAQIQQQQPVNKK